MTGSLRALLFSDWVGQRDRSHRVLEYGHPTHAAAPADAGEFESHHFLQHLQKCPLPPARAAFHRHQNGHENHHLQPQQVNMEGGALRDAGVKGFLFLKKLHR